MEKKHPLRELSYLSYGTLTDKELPAICETKRELFKFWEQHSTILL